MISDIDLFGVLVSPLLVSMLAGFAARLAVSKVLAAVGVYKRIWHRPLFDLSLYIILVWIIFVMIGTVRG